MEKYSKINMKFQDFAMLSEFFTSFLISFFGDYENVVSLDIKNFEVVKFIKRKKSTFTSCYKEDNPMCLVSASGGNFGEIVFSNDKLQNLLEISEESIQFQQISEFFPVNFTFFSNTELMDFKETTISSTSYIKESMMIIDCKGYLIEVLIHANLVSFNKDYYLFIIEPLELSRDIVLITKEGLILHYSEGLSRLIDIKEIQGKNISEILSLDFSSLKTMKNMKIMIKSRSFLISYKKLKIRNASLHMVHIIDYEDSFENVPINHEKIIFANKDKSVSFIIDERLNSTAMNNDNDLVPLDEEKTEQDKKINIVSSTNNSSSNFLSMKLKSYSSQSIRAIRYFLLILLISVINIQTIIVILSNCAILINLSILINTAVSQTAIDTIGTSLYSLSHLGDVGAVIQMT